MADPLKRAITNDNLLKLMKAFELLRLMDRERSQVNWLVLSSMYVAMTNATSWQWKRI